jgi:cobalt-zinc-cadmium efflux system outer membrane protein
MDKIRELRASVLPGAKEVFEASQEAYIQGKIDYLNVLDAQQTYFVSQTEYLEALATYHKAKADMEGLVGGNINTGIIQQ